MMILPTKIYKKKIQFIKFNGDVRSKNDIKKWLLNQKVSSIIHLAAVVSTELVNNNFEVQGTKGLYVCDASIFDKYAYLSSTSQAVIITYGEMVKKLINLCKINIKVLYFYNYFFYCFISMFISILAIFYLFLRYILYNYLFINKNQL